MLQQSPVRVCVGSYACVSVQEPGNVGEPGCGFYGLSSFLPWLRAPQPRLLQRLLGFPVLPCYRQLPVFPTEGKKKLNMESQWRRSERASRLLNCSSDIHICSGFRSLFCLFFFQSVQPDAASPTHVSLIFDQKKKKSCVVLEHFLLLNLRGIKNHLNTFISKKKLKKMCISQ